MGHVGVEGKRGYIEVLQKGGEAADGGDGVGEDQGTCTWMVEQEGVKV